jgi:hypothetical protein
MLSHRTFSHGVVQRSPLRRRHLRSPLPARRCCHLRAFGPALPALTAFRPRGFDHLDGFLLLRCDELALACRPWGSSRFRWLRSQLSRAAFLPSRALLLDRSDSLGNFLLSLWAPSPAPTRCCHRAFLVHRPPCPLVVAFEAPAFAFTPMTRPRGLSPRPKPSVGAALLRRRLPCSPGLVPVLARRLLAEAPFLR